MRIRMKTLAAGPEGIMQAGHEYSVSDTHGRSLIAGGFAESLETAEAKAPDAETAEVVPVTETAEAKPRTERRGRGAQSNR